MSHLLLAGATVDGGPPGAGWLRIDDGRIAAIGTGRPPGEAHIDLRGAEVVPGFVDPHCHGGLYSGRHADVITAARTHLTAGTTSLLASIATTGLPAMCDAARAIAQTVAAGEAPNIVGIHYEGPFLSVRRRGAQTSTALRQPDERVLEQLLEAAGGLARTMTIAPELPGALELIRQRPEIAVSLGHSDATATTFTAAVHAGARAVTHLFNALPALDHRQPGPVGVALTDQRLSVDLIADGHNVHDTMLRLAVAAAGPQRVLAVTDAMPAAGLGDGVYAFADRQVSVRDGAAHLRGTDTLAGSTLTLDRAGVRLRALTDSPAHTVAMTSANAARLLGLDDRGTLSPGKRADLVVLNSDGTAGRVVLAGRWI
ncbi:N-acetylglucosamine-6-phosphate deacetylase [Cryptosporangium sp. NPDC048952]|uniref:N-acetylglucosamine-6-phosphate deacetylase n=1 Tax=Cryptosporangium sp. NPDC048952 TaxID=3363961 RepID=UPI003721ECB8